MTTINDFKAELHALLDALERRALINFEASQEDPGIRCISVGERDVINRVRALLEVHDATSREPHAEARCSLCDRPLGTPTPLP